MKAEVYYNTTKRADGGTGGRIDHGTPGTPLDGASFHFVVGLNMNPLNLDVEYNLSQVARDVYAQMQGFDSGNKLSDALGVRSMGVGDVVVFYTPTGTRAFVARFKGFEEAVVTLDGATPFEVPLSASGYYFPRA